MKQRYAVFRRENGIYYSLDTVTRKRNSLNTTDREEARRFLNALNEACKQPAIKLQIAQVYLQHSDPDFAKRTWQHVMDEMGRNKAGSTKKRWDVAMKDKAFDLIRNLTLIKTQGEHFFEALHKGTVSTNVFLRRVQNFALDMDWIPKAVIPKRQWPAIQFKDKRAITLVEHQAIVEREKNPERKKFYELCWHLGGSQGDIACLNAEDVDWENRTISFTRKKTGVPVILHLGEEALNTLKDLPGEGLLFPYLARVRAGDRATEFKQRCRGLGIHGVSLHSYRYAWAERAKTCGYPERFAQEALGQNSKAVHRSYAKRARVKLPSLEEYENKTASFLATTKQ
ncbi:MAG: tyrosine-type recombinase/integrase [Verrucomicrobiae bacterium]|nr:tyrosine-type recombinase/integrase [Verrucomicrobiae bacterium]